MARPTSYTNDLLLKAKEYLEGYADLDQVIPTISGLALHIGVSRSILYKWEEEPNTDPEFLDILGALKEKQEVKLVNGGLSNLFNPTIAKMMLTKHGYSDKQDLTHSSPDGTMATKPTTINLVAGSPQEDDHSDD